MEAKQHVITALLDRAIRNGSIRGVKILLQLGGKIETKDKEGRTPLLLASAFRQTDVVRALVSAGADVNAQRNDGVSALSLASQEGHIDIVNMLLEHGAQCDISDNDGRTPLWNAASRGYTDVVRRLVPARADVNTQCNNGASVLSIASHEGYIDIVNMLLDNGAQIETSDNDSRTPLMFAAFHGQTDVVRALVSAGADVNTQRNNGASVLSLASHEGYIDIVNILLDNGAQIETTAKNGCTPLWFAAANGKTEVVRALVSAGADVNTQRNDGSSALRIASGKGYIDIVNVLLDNGAQIEISDNDGSTPLLLAAANGQTDIVCALVSAGADVNTQRNDVTSALSIASHEGYIDIVNMLLDNGAQIETSDNDGCTPLLFVAANGQTEVVHALLSAGADVNTQSNDGFSALGIASQEGYIDIVNVLLDNGAEIETRDNNGRTPLLFAAANGQTDSVHALLSAGADVNTQRNDGTSALCVAIQKGYIDTVNMLLDNGAEIETRDNNGRTPLLFAAANGQTDIVCALLSAGADVNTQRNDGTSALCVAIRNGHIDTVNVLLDNGAQIEASDNDGSTPLWFAADNGQTEVVRARADVNTQRNDGSSALGIASGKGYIDIVNVLLDNGAQIETSDNNGCTPLWVAAANGHANIVRALVSAGADVNTHGYDGVSALSIAIQEGYINIVCILLENGVQSDKSDNGGHTPLWDVWVALGNRKIRYHQLVGSVVSARDALLIPIDLHGGNLIHLEYECRDPLESLATFGGNQDVKEILWLLLVNGLCVNAAKHGQNQSALMLAVRGGNIDVVKDLIRHGADINDRNTNNMQPIDLASYYGHTDIVEFLSSSNWSAFASPCSSLSLYIYLPSGVHFDCRCNTAMHLTTNLQTMKSLLENGSDVEAENVDGLRPIHRAVRTGLVELVELLIQHGANVDAADVFGNRPLHDAVCHGLNVVQLLVQRGAKLNIQNIDGKTPLHIAVEREQSDIIVFLLSQGADVGLTDVWRNTPLHYVTSKLLAVSEVAESVARIFTKCKKYKSVWNIVGVSISVPITTGGTSDNQRKDEQYLAAKNISEVRPLNNEYDHNTQPHKLDFFHWDKLAEDCNGNTPLHYAVGVYGPLKIFRVTTDVTETVELLVKCGADINAQNKDGLTPLDVAHGREAIWACLRCADDQSFTITDKRGRNFWHLSSLTRTYNIAEAAKWSVKLNGAKYSPGGDDWNRTPLHYACMNGKPTTIKLFLEHTCDEYINKQDKFGRTALHYATIGSFRQLTDMLKAKKADETIQDNYQMTSDEYEKMRDNFNNQVSLLRLMKSSNFLAKHRRDISAGVRSYFSDSSSIQESKAKMHETVRNLTGFCDSASYVLSVWHGCRYHYRDTTRSSLDHGDQLLVEQEYFATNNNQSATNPMNMFEAIQRHVNKAMEELAKAITEHDHRFACKVFPVGSAYEETKIGCCDEFDYNFVLTELSSMCKVCYSPESPPGFVLLKASMPVYDEDLNEDLKYLFDHSGILNTRIIKFKFETLAKQILSSARFCDLTDFEFDDPASPQNFETFETRGNVAVKLNTYVQLVLTKPVNNCHVLHPISIDLVPALRIIDWWPDDAVGKELCTAGDCLIVFAQPQSKYPWIGWTEPRGFISFARAESKLLHGCRPVVKAAYMVVKRMSEYFCQYKFFPSHVIKTALFWCLDEEDLLKCRSSDGSDEVRGDELLSLVQNILRRLLCFAAQDYVPDFFMPKRHQPVWLKERYLKQYHMRLYQHGLTYKDLFNLSDQQSHDEVLRSIKTMFTFSHVMYWSLLSDTDDLKLFVPSAINPLCENSYDDSDE